MQEIRKGSVFLVLETLSFLLPLPARRVAAPKSLRQLVCASIALMARGDPEKIMGDRALHTCDLAVIER